MAKSWRKKTYEELHDGERWFFLRVMRANTMSSRGDAVCFYSRSLPKSRPTLRTSGGGTTLHVTQTPFTNHATDTLSGPLVRCPSNREVTPCHASDIFDINDGNTLKDIEDREMWPLKEVIVVNLLYIYII